MTPEAFCYWLQGHFELNDSLLNLDEKQTKTIKSHLNLVFKHSIDPKSNSQTTTPANIQNKKSKHLMKITV